MKALILELERVLNGYGPDVEIPTKPDTQSPEQAYIEGRRDGQAALAQFVLQALAVYDHTLDQAVDHLDHPELEVHTLKPAPHLGHQDCYEAGILEGRARLAWELRRGLNLTPLIGT